MNRPAHRSPSVKRYLTMAGRTAGRGAFKGAALVAAFLIVIAAWWYDAAVLTSVADENLQLIKVVTHALPLDWGSKAESALRIFGADRALLLVEAVAVAKIVMLALALPFRRRRARP